MDDLASARYSNALPADLEALLSAVEGSPREAAWQRFLAAHHELLLRTARSVAPDYDGAMDLYTRTLEQLRHDNFRRLRAYDSSIGRFETWLVVVVRRLFLDQVRELYGRQRGTRNPLREWRQEERAARKRLVELVTEQIEKTTLRGPAPDPELELRRSELSAALARALDSLHPSDRLLLKLRYEREMSAREILRLMEFPTVFHVYRRVDQILGNLRAELQRAGVRDPNP